MKARVKATGEIIEISEDCSYLYAEHYDKSYNLNELEFLDVKEKSFPKDEDYWIRLEHQYAGMAMQGILGNQTYTKNLLETSTSAKDARDIIIDASWYLAHALVEKMKEERK